MKRWRQVCKFIGWFANRLDWWINILGILLLWSNHYSLINTTLLCRRLNELQSGGIEDKEYHTVNGCFLWNSLQLWCAGAACTNRVTKEMKCGNQVFNFIGWLPNRFDWRLMIQYRGISIVLGSSIFHFQSQRSCSSWNELHSGGIEDQEDQTVNGCFLWNSLKLWCAGAACTTRATKGMKRGSQDCKFIGWFAIWRDWRPGGSDGERVVSMKMSSNLMRRGCM